MGIGYLFWRRDRDWLGEGGISRTNGKGERLREGRESEGSKYRCFLYLRSTDCDEMREMNGWIDG